MRQQDPANQHLDLLRRLDFALKRIEDLSTQFRNSSAADTEKRLTFQEALGFAWASAAWAAVELAQFWVLEKRLGMPRRETEAFDLLAREGIFGIDIARRLKQAVEYRNLPSRAPDRIDWDHLSAGARADIDLLKRWAEWSRGLAL